MTMTFYHFLMFVAHNLFLALTDCFLVSGPLIKSLRTRRTGRTVRRVAGATRRTQLRRTRRKSPHDHRAVTVRQAAVPGALHAHRAAAVAAARARDHPAAVPQHHAQPPAHPAALIPTPPARAAHPRPRTRNAAQSPQETNQNSPTKRLTTQSPVLTQASHRRRKRITSVLATKKASNSDDPVQHRQDVDVGIVHRLHARYASTSAGSAAM